MKEVAFFLRQQLGREVQLESARVGARNAGAWELVQKALTEERGAEQLVAAGDTAAASRQYRRADSLLASLRPSIPHGLRRRPSGVGSPLAGPEPRASRKHPEPIGPERGCNTLRRQCGSSPTTPMPSRYEGYCSTGAGCSTLSPTRPRAAKLLADAEADLRRSVGENAGQGIRLDHPKSPPH